MGPLLCCCQVCLRIHSTGDSCSRMTLHEVGASEMQPSEQCIRHHRLPASRLPPDPETTGPGAAEEPSFRVHSSGGEGCGEKDWGVTGPVLCPHSARGHSGRSTWGCAWKTGNLRFSKSGIEITPSPGLRPPANRTSCRSRAVASPGTSERRTWL